jgi:hypothetical protein
MEIPSVSTIKLTEQLSLSEGQRELDLSLLISAEISSTDKYRSIGTHFDPSFMASLPMEIIEAVFFRGIADGVIEGWYKSNFTLPEDGSDVNLRVLEFALSAPLESLTENELQALSRQLRLITADGVRKLLDSMAGP